MQDNFDQQGQTQAQDAGEVNPKKLFVGNLPFRMAEADIQELFAEYGEITNVHLAIDRMSGRSRGFAFVEYADDAAAQAAVAALDGKDIDGRALKVNVARPFTPRPRGEFRPRSSGGYNRGGGDRGGYNSRGGDRGGYGRSNGGYNNDRYSDGE